MTKLLSSVLILLATRSKCVSKDSKEYEKSFCRKKKCRQNFFKRILLKLMQKNLHQNRNNKKIYVGGALFCLPHHPPGDPPSGPGLLQIESFKPTGYRVSLVSVSESGLQRVKDTIVKVLNSLKNVKSTISHELKITII